MVSHLGEGQISVRKSPVKSHKIGAGVDLEGATLAPPLWSAVEFDNMQLFTCRILMNSGYNTYFPNLSLVHYITFFQWCNQDFFSRPRP